MNNFLTIVESAPGIQRDGTTFRGKSYTDGEWCRFYMGLPRKIGGCAMFNRGTNQIVRFLYTTDVNLGNQATRVYLGRASSLFWVDYLSNDIQGVFPESDVTPLENGAGAFTVYDNPNSAPPKINLWQFDSYTYNPGEDTEQSYVFAQVAPNAADISNTTEGTAAPDEDHYQGTGNVFYGKMNALINERFKPVFALMPPKQNDYKADDPQNPPYTSDQLTPGTDTRNPLIPLAVSGGVVSVGDFFFLYGNSGVVMWSSPGNPWQFPRNQIKSIDDTKIIQGWPTRGGSNASVLFWSLNSVILGQYSPTTSVVAGAPLTTHDFAWNTLRNDVSIMSAASVIEYDQNFYWVGANQFYVYNGIVQTLENNMNKDWFFNNIDLSQTSKIWGMPLPRYNEIWWFFVEKGRKECNRAIVYNVATKSWSDVVLARASGTTPQLFNYPIMASSEIDKAEQPQNQGKYGIWQHETGVDKVYLDSPIEPISSSFTTHVFNLGLGGKPDSDNNLLTRRIEPDFAQWFASTDVNFTNPMSVQVLTRAYANSPVIASRSYVFNEETPYVDLLIQGGLVQYKFTSNIVGGNYQMGKVMLTYSAGDLRRG